MIIVQVDSSHLIEENGDEFHFGEVNYRIVIVMN